MCWLIVEQQCLNSSGGTRQQQTRLQPAAFHFAADQLSHSSPLSGSVSSTWIWAAQAPSPVTGRQYSGGLNSPFPLSQWSGRQLGLCLSSAAAAPEQILAAVLSAEATKGRRRRRRRRGREEAEFYRATWLMTIPADGGRHRAWGCLPPWHAAFLNITAQIYWQRAWLTNTHSGISVPREHFEENQADGWRKSREKKETLIIRTLANKYLCDINGNSKKLLLQYNQKLFYILFPLHPIFL